VAGRASPHRPAPVATAHHPSPVAPHTGSDAISHGQSTNADAAPVQVKPYGGNRCRTTIESNAGGKTQILHRGGTSDATPAASAHSRPRYAPIKTRQPTANSCGSPPYICMTGTTQLVVTTQNTVPASQPSSHGRQRPGPRSIASSRRPGKSSASNASPGPGMARARARPEAAASNHGMTIFMVSVGGNSLPPAMCG